MATEIVTYALPVPGTTPPTAAQVARKSMVTAQVSMVDTSTTVVITHNLGLTTAQLASLFPLVTVNVETPGTAIPSFVIARTNSVSITLSKLSAAGSGGTYTVVIQRPNSSIT